MDSKVYELQTDTAELRTDPGVCELVYVYLSADSTTLLYSHNITALLEDNRVPTPLPLYPHAVAMLLQSGIVPPTRTVFDNIYQLGAGDTATIQRKNDRFALSISHDFPFTDENRGDAEELDWDIGLDLIATAVADRLNQGAPAYLFHSAGKDSNTVALALAEAGLQDAFTCVTHVGEGDSDESEIAAGLAARLGFKHEKIYKPDFLDATHIAALHRYFESIALPCMDNVALAYPLYTLQLDFHGANIIDGGGNDIYMGAVPGKTEYLRQKYFSNMHRLRFVADWFGSQSILRMMTNTRVEWAGMFGIGYGDVNKFLPDAINAVGTWRELSRTYRGWNYTDLRSDVLSGLVEQQKAARKVRNFAAYCSGNLILPFCDNKGVDFFMQLAPHKMYNNQQYKNKLPLRQLLAQRMDLDSDALGKMGYEYDFYTLLQSIPDEMQREIAECPLWETQEVLAVMQRLHAAVARGGMLAGRVRTFVQRIYLVSAWYNHNRYVAR